MTSQGLPGAAPAGAEMDAMCAARAVVRANMGSETGVIMGAVRSVAAEDGCAMCAETGAVCANGVCRLHDAAHARDASHVAELLAAGANPAARSRA